jgi:hypothetical protein
MFQEVKLRWINIIGWAMEDITPAGTGIMTVLIFATVRMSGFQIA